MDRTLRDISAALVQLSGQQASLAASPGLVRYGKFVDRPTAAQLASFNIPFLLYYGMDTSELYAWNGVSWNSLTQNKRLIWDDFFGAPSSGNQPTAIKLGGDYSWFFAVNTAGSVIADGTLSAVSAMGVWNIISAATVGASSAGFAFYQTTPTNGFAGPLPVGLKFGCRMKFDSANTRANLRFGFSDNSLSSANSNPTNCIDFVMYLSDTNYTAAIGLDAVFMEVRNAGAIGAQTVLGTTAAFTANFNVFELQIVTGGVAVFLNGNYLSTAITTIPTATQSLYVKLQTSGSVNPGVTQKAYIDFIYIDATGVNRYGAS
jgi:hypothetical protein